MGAMADLGVHKTDLIHYLTGFSYNTIRQSLSCGSFSRSNRAEIQQATELLHKLNISITIK